jgi:hypothetical protein
MKFHSPRQAAKVLGLGQATVHRHCVRHTGFGQWLDGRWRVPQAHIERVLAGETAAQIGRLPSLPIDNATGSITVLREDTPDLFSDEPAAAADAEMADAVTPDAEQDELRHRLLRSYFFSLGLRHHDGELSAQKRQSLVWSVSEDLLAIIRTLGIVPAGGLKDAIRDEGVLREYRALTGIDAKI